MTILPQYDEFGIYTTVEDIKNYVFLLYESGLSSDEEVIIKCLEYFGEMNYNLREYLREINSNLIEY
jgi:hypothetical protein